MEEITFKSTELLWVPKWQSPSPISSWQRFGNVLLMTYLPSGTQPEREYYSSLNKLTNTIPLSNSWLKYLIEKQTSWTPSFTKARDLKKNRCLTCAPILNLLRPFSTLTSLHATNMALTLCLPTSHICVENTVLAFMICLLFNLSYKVTITCKWNQLVYFAIITANKPNQPPDFHCISPVRFGNKAQNAKFSAKEQHQKLHISIVIFNPNN